MKHMAMVLMVCWIADAPSLAAQQVINERADQVTDEVQMGDVVFLSHDLNSTTSRKGIFGGRDTSIRVSVEQAGMSTLPSGYKRVSVLFRNHTDFPQLIEVRAQFFDSARNVAEEFTRWQRIQLPANAIQNFSANSINTATAQYRVEVRESR
jgi:hypothetical protein